MTTAPPLSILHFNDVYEIGPVSGGTLGGLARLATLRRRIAAANPNTLVTFAGDLYGPSGLNTARVEGEPLAGAHLVGVMNAIGPHMATFGDHEFNEIPPAAFAKRLAESRFPVVSSNVWDPQGEPFCAGDTAVQPYMIHTCTTPQGEALRLGVIGLTKPIRLATVPHRYRDPLEVAAEPIAILRPQVDLLLALTHQPLAADRRLGERYPEIDLILGGDDHHHLVETAGRATIVKSDANVRRVYQIDLWDAPKERGHRVVTTLHTLDKTLSEDPEVAAAVRRWYAMGFAAFRAEGWDPEEVVARAVVDLDGFETTIRQQPTALTDAITQGMQRRVPGAELALLCSWALRLDDRLPAGSPITRYQVRCAFPYGPTPLYGVALTGDFLAEILGFAQAHRGSGGYILTTPNVQATGATWSIAKRLLDRQRSYQVALASDLYDDFLEHIDAQRRRTDVQLLGHYGTLEEALIQQLNH